MSVMKMNASISKAIPSQGGCFLVRNGVFFGIVSEENRSTYQL